LASTRQRLAHLYGERHAFALRGAAKRSCDHGDSLSPLRTGGRLDDSPRSPESAKIAPSSSMTKSSGATASIPCSSCSRTSRSSVYAPMDRVRSR
jgi:hypothetical protein